MRESANLNWSHHELCRIEQFAFSRQPKPDLSLQRKNGVHDPTNFVPTTIPSQAESNSQEYS
jgi:hypothetical protein